MVSGRGTSLLVPRLGPRPRKCGAPHICPSLNLDKAVRLVGIAPTLSERTEGHRG